MKVEIRHIEKAFLREHYQKDWNRLVRLAANEAWREKATELSTRQKQIVEELPNVTGKAWMDLQNEFTEIQEQLNALRKKP